MDVYGKSDIGLVRQTNQDDIRFKKIDENALWAIVCDGMGGSNGGDIAASMAIDVISERFDHYFSKKKVGVSCQEVMMSAVLEAGKSIFCAAKKSPELGGMGTTVVAAILESNVLNLIHVGDSRAYIVGKKGITQLTFDHSVVQEMINKGQLTQEQAKSHPQKNVITRALGIQEDTLPEYTKYNLKKEEKILLCTDGLTNELFDHEIYETFREEKLEEIPEILVNKAKQRKGADNITVLIVV